MKDNLVEMLREKTEEANLDTILKTTFGGYSRKSVQEYIAMLRKHQNDMQQSFSEQLELAQTERDRLAGELADAKARTTAAEAALAEAKPLMEKNAGLEKDIDEAVERIQADAERLEELRQTMEQQKAETESLRAERDGLLARLEKEETQVSSGAAGQDTQEEPVGEGPGEKNSNGVLDLFERPETMQIQLAILTRERENAARRMENVLRQENNLFQALSECRAELEERRDQNQWMEAENNELSRRLSEQMGQNIALNREITHMRALNESLKRRLEAAQEQAARRSAQDAGDVFLWDFAQ
ncbi:MAG: hypothetical protein ACI4P4_01650 [Faecousia sp.]